MKTETLPTEKLIGVEHYRKFFSENKMPLLFSCGIYIHSVAIFYTNYFFYPGYMEAHGLLTSATISEIRVFMSVFFIVIFLFFAKKANKKNYHRLLKIASIGTLLLIFPLHFAMLNYGVPGYFFSMAILTVLNVVYLLPIAGLLAGLFAKKYRYTGVSLSINTVSSLFGGTAPLILTFLIGYFNSFLASGAYLFFTATIGYLTVIWLGKRSTAGVI
jgi:MHS family proline/betaine transporter-like MFS transporter